MADFKRVDVEMLFSIKEDSYSEGDNPWWVGAFHWRPGICDPEWEDNYQGTALERRWLEHEAVF